MEALRRRHARDGKTNFLLTPCWVSSLPTVWGLNGAIHKKMLNTQVDQMPENKSFSLLSKPTSTFD